MRKYLASLDSDINYTYIDLQTFTDNYFSEEDKNRYIQKLKSEEIRLPYALYRTATGSWLPFKIDDSIRQHLMRFSKTLHV